MMLQDSNKNTLNSAAQWLQKSDKLTEFAFRQQQDQALKAFLLKHIEELGYYKDDFHIAAIEQKKLSLHTNSSVIAAQLRLQESLILQKLENDPVWKGVFTKLKVVVRPNFKKQLSVQQKLPQMSTETALMLQQSAENTDHPRLKKALENLARQGRLLK